MQRPQKISKDSYPCEGMLETKSNKGACSNTTLETQRKDGAQNLLEKILDRNNLNQAYLKVVRNIGSPLKLKFLGFSLYKVNGKVGIRAHQKTIKRFKDKIRKLTSRKQCKPISIILKKLKQYTTGWLGYYAICDMDSRVKSLNEWIRRRVRQIYWKQWKKVSARYDKLKKLGIDKYKAWEWANTRKGYWRISDSYILHRTLTNKYLESEGYDDISKRYKVLHLSYPTAVYGTVRTVV